MDFRGLNGSLAAGLLGIAAFGGAAQAEQVAVTSPAVFGALNSSTPFQVSGAGTITVTFNQSTLGDPLSSLSFVAASPAAELSDSAFSLGPGTLSGSLSFKVGSAGFYSAIVSAVAAPGKAFSLGQYTMNVSFTPTPLPPGVWLLLSGLGGLGAAIRGRKPLWGLPAAAA